MNAVQLIAILRQGGWPENRELLISMAAIGLAESSGNPRAVNPGTASRPEHSVGLWQINLRAHGTKYGTEEQLKDPITNAEAALDIYKSQGLRAWGAYTDGRYKQAGRYTQATAAYDGGSSNQTETVNNTTPDNTDSETAVEVAGAGAALLVIGTLAYIFL